MADEADIISVNSKDSKIDPNQFDATISALLMGLGAEKYVDIFREHNIGQYTIAELTDEDLIKLGVDNTEIRKKILNEVKNLPIFQEISTQKSTDSHNLSPIEFTDILEESSEHLFRIYMSMLANTIALKKTPRITDSLLYRDKYASDVALSTLSELTNIMNQMEIALHTKMKALTKDTSNKKNKKIIVGTIGSAVIVALAVLFAKSLKQLK